ncbi:2-hydroxyacid dehydrogenase [Bordetella pertussis]|uniref:2-hydroxyacid dehydrogenase n=35 Tax=Bordetella pertussis TaxID=520 RepID=Q7VU57_BORPE|nr:D-2-hydroxyacid dehydrogenase family protein [Bordetella pertussis]ETH39224.1 4-phosphoerythronate dehydrogenase [Bordetella pertussis H918]ETH42819.1 4-phosphoerythronate dehydrogenase [Bordetella pertussis H939]ETH46577.1 4-phosphoerythronate dehydrogenase [Bordetella pertussis H921]ETH73231.1 4-phosphoerythronate dehydrogenase [Bordetella pertussis STO1-CHLA-0011]ETH83662.1 4-phosphoerythronate dehydrogenase [Bordetella pertussis STO1-CHOC-0017]ETH85282.1 4-phosphoerythronate dehydrogen
MAERYADWTTLGAQARVQVFRDALPSGPARAVALQPFDVIVAMRERTPFPAELIQALPALRLLVTTGMRNNAIDMQACAAGGILVCGAPGSAEAGAATAELAWAHILALFKRLPQEDAAMRRGLWQTGMPQPLARRRLGVLGLGKLGSAVAQVGRAFGMEVVAWSPNLTDERAAQAGVTRVDKHTLFSTADVVSLHLILGESTRHIVDAAALSAMKPSAYLVNTSRAGLVDQDALLDALRKGRLAGAGLDVYESEPLPPTDVWRTLDNVLLTPHLGYVNAENFQAFYANALEAVRAWAAGAPVHVLGGARG